MQEWFVKKYFNTSYVMVQPIIIGGVQKFTNPIAKEHVKDVVISDKQFKNKFIIKDTGEIFVESEENINILSQKDVIIKGQKIWLN